MRSRVEAAGWARISDASLSWPVLAFAAAASLAAAIHFGLVPAIESFRLDLIATLRASGRGWLGTLAYGVSARDPLSYALALVLLPGAALLGSWPRVARGSGQPRGNHS